MANHVLPADHAEITGRDDFIVGLALAYAIAIMESVDLAGRMPESDWRDIKRLFARYPEYLREGLLASVFATITGRPRDQLSSAEG